MVGFLSGCTFEIGSKRLTEGPKQSEETSGILLSFGTTLGVRNAFSSVGIIISFCCESKFSCCLKKSSSLVSSSAVSMPSSKWSCQKKD